MFIKDKSVFIRSADSSSGQIRYTHSPFFPNCNICTQHTCFGSQRNQISFVETFNFTRSRTNTENILMWMGHIWLIPDPLNWVSVPIWRVAEFRSKNAKSQESAMLYLCRAIRRTTASET